MTIAGSGFSNEGERSKMTRLTHLAAVVVLLAAPLFGTGAEASSPGDGNPVLTPMEGSESWTMYVFVPEDYEEAEYFLDGSARTYPEGSTPG